MHLGNAALTPECAAVTTLGAAAGMTWLAWADRGSSKPQASRGEVLAWTAFVFAAQAWNLPILPWASAHLVGGALLSLRLGATRGALAMGVILAVQALVMGDGGWQAWGCNFLNMALLPASGILLLEKMLRREVAGDKLGNALGACVAAGSVVLAAAAICAEVLLFRSEPLPNYSLFAQQMLSTHLPLGVWEGGLTYAILLIVHAWQSSSWSQQPMGRFVAATVSAILMAAVFFSSSLPDGYEAALLASGWNPLAETETAVSQLGELVTLAGSAFFTAGICGIVLANSREFAVRQR